MSNLSAPLLLRGALFAIEFIMTIKKTKNIRPIIYQVLPRLFANPTTTNIPHGTLEENGSGKMNAFTPEVLKRIRKNGYTHIWYTGLLEHATQSDYKSIGIQLDHAEIVKGKAGSPYAIKDYYDIDPDLAVNPMERMKEFEALVKRTHNAKLKFIMDFVPNHVAREYHSDAKPRGVKDLGEEDDKKYHFLPNNNFYYCPGSPLDLSNICSANAITYKEIPARATGNDQFSATPSNNDWYETIKLNYGVDYSNGNRAHFDPVPSTWKKMTHILLFWASKGVDAFRCDMAEMVPVGFWHYAIAEVKAKYPEMEFIAEVYNPNEYRNYIQYGGFDYLYDKVGLYDTLRQIVCANQSAATITSCWQQTDDIRNHLLHFLENHDEQRIASDFFCGNPWQALPALVVSACIDAGAMIIYAGQELGERGMDEEGFSGRDGRTTIFDYWHVQSLHKLANNLPLTKEEEILTTYYHRLLSLLNTQEALREGTFFDLMYVNYDGSQGLNPDRHFAFMRKHGKQTLLIVANFSPTPTYIGVKIPAAAFEYLGFTPGLKNAHDLLSGDVTTIDLQIDQFVYIDLPMNGAALLSF